MRKNGADSYDFNKRGCKLWFFNEHYKEECIWRTMSEQWEKRKIRSFGTKKVLEWVRELQGGQIIWVIVCQGAK